MTAASAFSFEELFVLLRGRQVSDTPCPACSQFRKAINRSKPVLRLWRIDDRLISYYCVHCGASGYTWAGGEPSRVDPATLAEAIRQRDALNAEAVASRRERVRSIYARRWPVPNTLAETYLRKHRKIYCRLPETMGFLPDDGRHPPAVVMPFGFAREIEPGVLAIRPEAVMAIHLTQLNSDGSKLSKIIFGRGAHGFPIVVAPPNDLLGLAITEGIEDALSLHEATGLGVWAAGPKDRLAALADAIPAWMDSVSVRPDDDDDGGGRKRALELVQAIRRRIVPGLRGNLHPMHAELNEDGGS